MARLIITRRYDHRWPSRAMTCFQPREEPYTVRREVLVAAVAGGYGFEPENPPHEPSAPPDAAGELDGQHIGQGGTGAGLSADADVHVDRGDDGAFEPLPE